MKLVLAALCAYGASGAKTYKAGLKVATAVLATEEQAKKSSATNLGKKNCRCIGISDLAGTIKVNTGDGMVDFPAELGASCQPWENEIHPSCKIHEPLVHDFDNSSYIKDNPNWCLKSWCYVDPCECDLDPPAKTSSYLPDGMYQGKPLYYSYATCGSVDSYTSAEKLAQTEKEEEEADEAGQDGPDVCNKDVEDSVWGDEGCMCVGLDGQPGSNQVTIKGKTYNYSGNLGSRCSAWDDDEHPSCTASNPPKWCKAKWCYVDPCECSLPVSPKTSDYMPGAKYQGHRLYYSYAACKSEDSYTAKELKGACTDQEDEDACKKLDKCAWNEGLCLGKELITECSGKKFEDEEEEEKQEEEKEDDKSEKEEESPEDKAVAESIDGDDKSQATPEDESEEKAEDKAAQKAEKEEEAEEKTDDKTDEKADEEAAEKDKEEEEKEKKLDEADDKEDENLDEIEDKKEEKESA